MRLKRLLIAFVLFAITWALPFNNYKPQVQLSSRGEVLTITNEVLDNFKLYSQYSAAAYCSTNTNSDTTNTVSINSTALLECSTDFCPLVQHNKAFKFYEFAPDKRHSSHDVRGYIAIDPVRNETIVSFRGTKGLSNRLANLHLRKVKLFGFTQCQQCRVHVGFASVLKERVSDVYTAILKADEAYPNNKLVFTGHSLGGAMATVMGVWTREHGFPTADIWTYGAPRVGNVAWAKFVNSQPGITRRMTHLNDPVPRLPPSFWPFKYAHGGTEFWLGPKGSFDTINYNSSDVRICDGIESKACNSGAKLFPFNVKAHHNYLGIIDKCPWKNSKRDEQNEIESMFAENKNLENVLIAEQGYTEGILTDQQAFEIANATIQLPEAHLSTLHTVKEVTDSPDSPPEHKKWLTNGGKCWDCWLGSCPADDKKCH